MRRFLVSMVIAIATLVGPTWVMAGNQEVAENIAASLGERFPGYNLAVKYQNGQVWLRGELHSQEQLDAALDHAAQIPGVTNVINELNISENAIPTKPLQTSDGAMALEPVQRNDHRDLWSSRSKRVASNRRSDDSLKRLPQVNQDSRSSVRQASGDNNPNPSLIAASVQKPVVQQPKPASPPAQVQPVQQPKPASPRAQVQPLQQPRRVAQRSNVMETPTQLVTPTKANPVVSQGPVPNQRPLPVGSVAGARGYMQPHGQQVMAGRYDQPNLPNYAWPSTAAYPNYSAVCYPKNYSACSWPYIGPYYPYPQVPLGWRKVTMEWHDGYWWLDFDDGSTRSPFARAFRMHGNPH